MSGSNVSFDDIAVGDEGPEVSQVLSRTDLVMYAGASGDFNPMHHDDTKAEAAGLPSVFGHGMFTAGLLSTAIEAWVGHGTMKRYRVRFTKQTWPGETLTTKIAVTEKRKDGGDDLLDLDCSVVNQDGEVKVAGDATVAV